MKVNYLKILLIALCTVSILLTGYSQEVSITFKKQVLHTDFVSEGVTVGDVNKDGRIDIMAGPFWFEAPSWQKHEIFEVQQFNYRKGYSNSMLNFSMDVNFDGWVDLIRIDFPGKAAYWHENPKNKRGHWPVHTIYERVGNESPHFVDMDGDGRRDLVFGDPQNNQMLWMRAPTKKGNPEWTKFTISKENVEGTKRFAHGMGVGDLNGDGRNDVFVKQGWWEGPADVTKPDWTFHPENLGDDCSHMYAYDVDADGDNDVVSASAHYSGFWWHEQVREGSEVKWVKHIITQTIAETHAVLVVDINSDGRGDFITGNRYFAHNSEDPTDHGPAVISWFTCVSDKKPNPKWTEYPIDDDSGVGLNITAEDITADGLVDIVIANKKGIFFFEQQRKTTPVNSALPR